MADDHIQDPVTSVPTASTNQDAVSVAEPAKAKDKPVPVESKDNLREIVETIVFVIVLVLLLKSFVAEAFVIPTGSMAETLYGYQKDVVCPKCQFEFPLNCSSEVDPPEKENRVRVDHCVCPNCRYAIDFQKEGMDPHPKTGDRVLVDKSLYDLLMNPERFNVVVFKYPVEPQKNHVPMNYIKRLIGQPGETIAIYYGNLYMSRDLNYQHRLKPETSFDGDVFDPTEEATLKDYERARKDSNGGYEELRKRLRKTAMYEDDAAASELFRKQVENHFEQKVNDQGFEIIRKDPDKIRALRRIVYDNDYQAKDLAGKQPSRWSPERQNRWKADQALQPRLFTSQAGDDLAWLNYRHVLRNPLYRLTEASLQALQADEVPAALVLKLRPLVRDRLTTEGNFLDELRRVLPAEDVERYQDKLLNHAVAPALITDFMGYNTGRTPPQANWVGDLMLDCDVTIDKPEGELVLELAKSSDRFQARWDLATGNCTLVRIHKVQRESNGQLKEELREEVLGAEKTPTNLKKKGTYRLRLANFDERLTVWVDGSLPFGPGVTYKPKKRGPTELDLLPARVGVRGASVHVSHLKLWRDTYYTIARGDRPDMADAEGNLSDVEVWRDPTKWEALQALPFKTIYVQPDHYLCMGDNSPESSDGRSWGLVPRRLMLGRALLVYWPHDRAGPIR